MRLGDRQALVLFQIAKGTTDIAGNIGGYTTESRLAIVNKIILQQDDTVVEVGDKKDEEQLNADGKPCGD
ncbi:MAG: hypothetical protein U9Q07_03925 [Planctomycetota bacterium]|nr:hypothetical protein [Planctomycetota bacterium]